MSVFDWLFGRRMPAEPRRLAPPASAPPEPADAEVRTIHVRHYARSSMVGGDVYIRVVDVLELLNRTRSAWGPFSMVLPHQVTDFVSNWLRSWSEDVMRTYEKSTKDGAHAATDSGSDEEPIGDEEDDEIDREIAEIEREVEAARAVAAEDAAARKDA